MSKEPSKKIGAQGNRKVHRLDVPVGPAETMAARAGEDASTGRLPANAVAASADPSPGNLSFLPGQKSAKSYCSYAGN